MNFFFHPLALLNNLRGFIIMAQKQSSKPILAFFFLDFFFNTFHPAIILIVLET